MMRTSLIISIPISSIPIPISSIIISISPSISIPLILSVSLITTRNKFIPPVVLFKPRPDLTKALVLSALHVHREPLIRVANNKMTATDIAHSVSLRGIDGLELSEELILAGLLLLRLFKGLLRLCDHTLLAQPLGLSNDTGESGIDLGDLCGEHGALRVLVLVYRLVADLAVEVAQYALDLAAEVLLETVLAPLGLFERTKGGERARVVFAVADADVKLGLLE